MPNHACRTLPNPRRRGRTPLALSARLIKMRWSKLLPVATVSVCADRAHGRRAASHRASKRHCASVEMAGKCCTSLVLDETERVYWPSTGQSHDYKRHGTTTLFAALEVTTRKDHRGPFKTASPHRVSRLHEQRHRGFSGPLASRHPRQPQHPLEKRALAQGPPQRALTFHANKRVLAQSGRGMVLDLQGKSLSGASQLCMRLLRLSGYPPRFAHSSMYPPVRMHT